jgi:hypothetical protein
MFELRLNCEILTPSYIVPPAYILNLAPSNRFRFSRYIVTDETEAFAKLCGDAAPKC